MRHLVKYIAAVAALLLTAAQPIVAQDDNAAFYIYQNDGHFDGFFYDQVKKISYSKLDTLGVEHDDYVSQEITTADSTYRIMLTAIDSVGFVQPEIKFNPKMRNLREEGMIQYMTAHDDNSVTFSSSMPENLRPRAEDVLVDFDLNDGFSLRVISVNNTGGSIVAVCEDITSIHDIFEQYICLEQYGADETGKIRSRRVAGRPDLTVKHDTKREQFNFNLFNFSYAGHITLYADSVTRTTVSLDANIDMAGDLKAVWNFPGTYDRMWHGKKDYVGLTLTLNNELSAGFTIDGKIKDVFPSGVGEFGKLPLPAAAPILVIDFGPDGMVRGEVHAKFGFKTPKFKGKLWYMLEFDDWSPSINFGHGNPPNTPIEDAKPEANPWEGSFEFSGFAQGGIQFPLKLSTNKLLEKILKCEVGTTVYVGPKVTGTISVDLIDLATNGFNVYGNFKDSKLSLSYLCADYETKAKTSAFWGKEKEITLADGSFSLLGDVDCYLFPDFELDATAVLENIYRGATITATLTPSRNIFFPANVGVGAFRNNKLEYYCYATYWNNAEPYRKEYYWQFNKEWLSNPTSTMTFYLKEEDEYEIRPILNLSGGGPESIIVGSQSVKLKVPGARIKPNPKSPLQFNWNGGTKKVKIDYNVPQFQIMETESSYHPSKQFNATWNEKDSTLTITQGKLHGVFKRTESVRLYSPALDKGYLIQQYGDSLYNRIGFLDARLKAESVIEGSTITIKAKKKAEDDEIESGHGEEYDATITFALVKDTLLYATGNRVADATITYKKAWEIQSYNPLLKEQDIKQITYIFNAHDGRASARSQGGIDGLFSDDGTCGVSFMTPMLLEDEERWQYDRTYTLKRITTYAVYDEDLEKYVIQNNKTETDDLTEEGIADSVTVWYQED